MIRSCLVIKIVKNFFNFLFSFRIDSIFKTTTFETGKQTTFICGKCGIPFNSRHWDEVCLEYKKPLNTQHLLSVYFKILKYKKFYRGLVLRPQVQYFESIKDKSGQLMTCSSCSSSNFQNIVVIKLLNINLAIVL